MKKQFYKCFALALSVITCLFLFAGCQGAGSSDQKEAESAEETNDNSTVQNTGRITMENANLDSDDLYSDWENESYTSIVLGGNTISIDGSDARVDENAVTITGAGTYVLSGTLTDGVILVDADKGDDVRLVLNGVSIHCSNGAPLFVQSADKVVISLPYGTSNTLSDGENYSYDYYSEEDAEPSAALFSKDDLVINGNGSLTINGNHNDAIACNDRMKITGGTLVLSAADDGLVANDMVAIMDVELSIDAGGDGIKVTNDEEGTGYIAIQDGQFTIVSAADGIQAATCLYIEGGTFDITTGGGSSVSSANSNDWGEWGGKDGRNPQMPKDADEKAGGASSSAKSFKAVSSINIVGGTFSFDCSDDAIHSNGTVEITGGTFQISSGDDGIHADTSIQFSGGNMTITESYEGIESALIEISGGCIDVTARDDGFNVSGGNDGSSMGGRPGQNNFNSSNGDSLNISGGTITIDASGDGLDSNGSLYISGGTTYVSGPTNSGNGTLDYAGVCEITGGILVGVGSTGMAESPSSGTTQYTIAGALSSSQPANSTVSLLDEDGNEILSFTSPKIYQYVVFSSADIEKGETYTICVNGSVKEEVTVSSVVTVFNQGATQNRHR